MKIKAVIPVRGGSERVLNKNNRSFAGSNLLAYKIRTLLACEKLDGVLVNSDSDILLDIAKSEGAEIHKRDPYFASGTVPMNEVYENMAQVMNCDIILHAPATSPLVKSSTYDQLIDRYLERDTSKYDSLNTVSDVKEFLWQGNAPLNFDLNAIPKSQDLPDVVAFNWAAGIISRDLMISRKSVVGFRPDLVRLSHEEAFDIDTNEQFEFADFLYRKNRL